MKAKTILNTIGNTPHVRINKLFEDKAEVWMKLERSNPSGSIKDRIALAMVEDAERKGILKEDSIIIEPTSGNTGVGLAMVAAVKGYHIILVMPESMSLERRKLMAVYGAKLELTPREKGMKGAIEKAKALVEENENAWMPMQFDNEANVQIHIETTAQEIMEDFPEGLDYLITGVGTGGHITGVAKVLKSHFTDLKVFAVEPEASAVLSGGQPGPHPIQGIGAGFIPNIMDTSLLDGVITIERDEAYDFARRAAREEGIFIGISSGASLAAINKKLDEGIAEGARILTFCYDTGERYLSVDDLFV
jgi:cysteine synthase